MVTTIDTNPFLSTNSMNDDSWYAAVFHPYGEGIYNITKLWSPGNDNDGIVSSGENWKDWWLQQHYSITYITVGILLLFPVINTIVYLFLQNFDQERSFDLEDNTFSCHVLCSHEMVEKNLSYEKGATVLDLKNYADFRYGKASGKYEVVAKDQTTRTEDHIKLAELGEVVVTPFYSE